MKKLCLLALLAVVWVDAPAAGNTVPVPPVQVIYDLIAAAKANDLDAFARHLDCGKVAMGPHGRSLANTIMFLRSIDLDTAEVLGTSTGATRPPPGESVILRTRDDEFRFDLELRASELLLGERPYSHREVKAPAHYMVIEIHQHR